MTLRGIFSQGADIFIMTISIAFTTGKNIHVNIIDCYVVDME